jgi:hypothetical protein
MKKVMMAFAVVVLTWGTAWAMEDTKANREEQADRYFAAMPMREMLASMAEQAGKVGPEEKRQELTDLFTKKMDAKALEKALKSSLVKNLTADEIKALADFYSSPAGKSAMKKFFGPCMADFGQAMMAEMMKARSNADDGKLPGPQAAPAK